MKRFRNSRGIKPLLAGCVLSSVVSADPVKPSSATVDAEGTIHTPNGILPISPFVSPEARSKVTIWLQGQVKAGGAEITGSFTKCGVEPNFSDPEVLLAVRACYLEKANLPEKLAELRRMYDVDIKTTTIGGIETDIVTPKGGVNKENQNRALIQIHGSALYIDHPDLRKPGSIPMAALGKIKVYGVDYRMAPEGKHPDALVDVASVYKELLKTYRPENIGIYGCSAGAQITTWSMAWFQKQGLPTPGAISINGESGVYPWKTGDSLYYNGAFMGRPYAEKLARPQKRKDDHYYVNEMDDDDEIMNVDSSLEALSKFPPTLFINSTRDSTLSSAIHLHRQLTRAGVEANLQIWEGLPHCFYTHMPDIPEAREAYEQMIGFFNRHLGAAPK